MNCPYTVRDGIPLQITKSQISDNGQFDQVAVNDLFRPITKPLPDSNIELSLKLQTPSEAPHDVSAIQQG